MLSAQKKPHFALGQRCLCVPSGLNQQNYRYSPVILFDSGETVHTAPPKGRAFPATTNEVLVDVATPIVFRVLAGLINTGKQLGVLLLKKRTTRKTELPVKNSPDKSTYHKGWKLKLS